MSGKDSHPPPGQREPTGEEITVTGEPSTLQTAPQQQNVPLVVQQNNMAFSRQTMPQQYMQNNQQPMPQMQYTQQQYNQQQFYQQPMPRQQYVQPIPHLYVQQMPLQATQQQYAQPMQVQMMNQSPAPFMATSVQPWTTGLFDCADDLENCLITFFCPCITLGQIAEITDRGMSTCTSAGLIYALLLYFTGCHWVYSWMYRTRLRTLYSLPEDPCHDCLVHYFCDGCALCQEYRELQNRGFNMQLGWIGNMQLQAQKEAATNAPPPVQGMTR